MVTDAPTDGQTGVNMPRMKLDSEFTPKETNRENADTQAEIILNQDSQEQGQSSSIIDPLAYMAQATPTTSLPPLSTSQPQPAVLSPNDAMMATMTQIANLLSGFQKQFPPTNNQLRQKTLLLGNVGNTGSRGNQSYGNVTTAIGKKVICYNCRGEGHVARQCKEPKRAKDSQYFKDKMLLMEAKEKGATLDAEAEAFLANVECTAPYDQPLAMTTTNIFEVNHEDAYDSDMDEGLNAAAAFMANLSSTSGTNGATTSQVNEVHTDANQIFNNVNHLLTHEMHQEEHLDFDVESDIDDNTISYHQYQLDSEVQDVPTEVSSAPPGEISMITILDDLRTQLDGHLKVNQEQSLVNDSLRAELAKCKLEIVRLDTQQVKLDLECQVRQEQNLVTQRNVRNAELEQEKVMLKTHLKSKDISIEFLKSENQKVLTDKKKLKDKYLDEIEKRKRLHQVINASNVWDTDETLASAEVSMAKMKGKPGHVRPASGFYEKLNAMMFVPQKELSREQVYWLPANEIASQASTPAKPVTPYVPKSPPPSQVLATLHNIKAVFPQFDAIIKERTTVKPLYVSLPCYEYAKEFALQQVVPFLDYFKKHVQTADDTIVKEVAEFKEIHYALEDEYERSVTPSSNCSCNNLRLECDREHNKVLELKAVISKQKRLITESEKLRIQLDSYKVENVNLKRRYEELSNSNTYSRSTFTAKINALTAENAKLKTELSGKKSSGSTASEKLKVLASGMYTNSSKYVSPPKRANWVKPTPLPKKTQVTFQEPPRTSNRPTQKIVVQQNKKPNVPVNLSIRTKPATESRKPMPKSHTRNHRILPSKSVNARRAADHNRKLNFVDHNQFVIRSLKSVNNKNPQAKHSVNHTKEVWKATRNHNVNTTKTDWRPTGKVVGSVKPQWKPTGHFCAVYN
ncbi:uncharacterized mitochondrial protein-like protein [Tanacetum coccineum]|uniref:Uncharacterized mitochondrial protein-like protein n=1 Tax=Tanacetum coccineum TaxID=301880 RepID=A0ABQ5H6M9_9ASTR